MDKVPLLESLPPAILTDSAWVDFLHFVACGKPVVRTKVKNEFSLRVLQQWCSTRRLFFLEGNDRYVCIGSDAEITQKVLEIDQSPQPHVFELGQMLGYPKCCCEFVSTVGESQIDELEIQVTNWNFCGQFRLIDPKGYLFGTSLICHIPCSTTCAASLQLAHTAIKYIRINQNYAFTGRWKRWY
ncbi:MAG: hypothetical protein IPJ94_17650 [Chloroflexi bacterium]|nr:hypothetical protein [Chloroflexota bacterium]